MILDFLKSQQSTFIPPRVDPSKVILVHLLVFSQHKFKKAINLSAMSEKLCLQWNDFKANVNYAFGRLRDDKEFTDVTLACEDGQQVEAHKVILAASSPFFEKILQRNKHPHPLIYLRGFDSQDLLAILDFLYFGEANVYQENLDSFLAIADELKLKGLNGQTSSDLFEEQEISANPKPIHKPKATMKTSQSSDVQNIEEASQIIAVSNQFSGDLQALDEKVKSMMEKSQNMINRKRANGTLNRETTFICKVCGKEDRSTHIIDHIEANHLEGISIPCDYCDKAFSSRATLRQHRSKYHNK